MHAFGSHLSKQSRRGACAEHLFQFTSIRLLLLFRRLCLCFRQMCDKTLGSWNVIRLLLLPLLFFSFFIVFVIMFDNVCDNWQKPPRKKNRKKLCAIRLMRSWKIFRTNSLQSITDYYHNRREIRHIGEWFQRFRTQLENDKKMNSIDVVFKSRFAECSSICQSRVLANEKFQESQTTSQFQVSASRNGYTSLTLDCVLWKAITAASDLSLSLFHSHTLSPATSNAKTISMLNQKWD